MEQRIEVDRHCSAPGVGRDLGEGRCGGSTGIVDEDRDRTLRPARDSEGIFDLRDVCHISGSDQRVRQTRGDFLQRFTAAADEGGLRPLPCQRAGYGGTDTSAAASDERMMALEAHPAWSSAPCPAKSEYQTGG